MLALSSFFLRVLGRHVMADDATAHRAQYGVMAGKVTGNAADGSALQTSFCLHRRRHSGPGCE